MKCSVCGKESFPVNGKVMNKTLIHIRYQCSDVNCSNPDTVKRAPGTLTPEENAVVR
jgi:hypothetical protein